MESHIPEVIAKFVSTRAHIPWSTQFQLKSGLVGSLATLINRMVEAMHTLLDVNNAHMDLVIDSQATKQERPDKQSFLVCSRIQLEHVSYG